MTKKQKAKALKKIVDGVILAKDTVDGEIAGGDKDEVVLWILKKYGKNHVIFCWYFIWYDGGWAEKPISEQEGPAMLNCPIRFFGHKFGKSDIFEQWRYEVKKYHEEVGPIVQDDEVTRRLVNSLKNNRNY